MVINTAELPSTKPKLRFCTGPNPAHSVSEIRNCDDICQWPQLDIMLNAFHWSTIQQNLEWLTRVAQRLNTLDPGKLGNIKKASKPHKMIA